MELSVMSPVLNDMELCDAIKYLSSLGVDSLELGAGGYPGKAHLDPEEYLKNPEKVKELKALLEKYNIKLSALACHGNPVHPNKEIAEKFHNDFVNAMKVAVMLGTDTIIGFSGCPGDSENSKNPNWVTCAWPPDYLEILNWQWNEVIIPYWKKTAEIAKEIGIKKIAFEKRRVAKDIKKISGVTIAVAPLSPFFTHFFHCVFHPLKQAVLFR